MRQKFLIIPEKSSLTIKESSELDKGIFQQIGEFVYDSQVIGIAKSGNLKELIEAIRTPAFYPVNDCAVKLAESIIGTYRSGETDPIEVAFSDNEQLARDDGKPEDDSDASADIDALLDDSEEDDIEGDDDLLKDESIKDLSSTIKIADEDDLIDDDDK